MRYTSIALVGLALAAFVEVAASIGRAPFTYGQRCFEAHALEKDGWTLGNLRVAVPPAATTALLTIAPGAQDIARRSLDVEVMLSDGEGAHLLRENVKFERNNGRPQRVALALVASADGKRFLEVSPSHCFVPLNLGYSLGGKHDTRRMGVLVLELRFVGPDGTEMR